jgi:hypothetical protein
MKEKFKEILYRIIRAVTSKKFFCLMIAVYLTYQEKMTGDNIVWVMAVYMGVQVAQNVSNRWMDR